MNVMLVEKLGSVSLRNGVVRIQCIATGADGQDQVTGELVVPAVQFGMVIGGMQSAGKQLQERLEQARAAQEESKQSETPQQ